MFPALYFNGKPSLFVKKEPYILMQDLLTVYAIDMWLPVFVLLFVRLCSAAWKLMLSAFLEVGNFGSGV